MTTKPQMLDTIISIETQNRRLQMKIEELEAANKSLSLAVQSSLPELEVKTKGCYPAQEHNIWSRNSKVKDAGSMQFKALAVWAGRNCGYGDTEEEKQATGLGGMIYHDCNVSFVLRFAAEVCEQHNWHQEAAKLMDMYEIEVTPWEERLTKEPQTVNWWAD